MSLEMAHKVILPPKKNYIPQFLKQRDINSYKLLDFRPAVCPSFGLYLTLFSEWNVLVQLPMNLRRYIQIKINVYGNTGIGNQNTTFKSQKLLVIKRVNTKQHCTPNA
jgi:hypothetical protein